MTQRLAMLVSNQPRDDQEERKREKEKIDGNRQRDSRSMAAGEKGARREDRREERREKESREVRREAVENTHGM